MDHQELPRARVRGLADAVGTGRSQLDTEFSAPTSPEDYPDGYLEGDEESPDDAPPASNEGAKDEL